jgi:hypothetical protein
MENTINDLQLRIAAMENENKKNNDVLQKKIGILQQENMQKDQEIKLLEVKLASLEAESDAHRDLNYDSECDDNVQNNARKRNSDRHGHKHDALNNAADPNYNSSGNEHLSKDICFD